MNGSAGLAEGTAQIVCTGDVRKPGCQGTEFRLFGTVGVAIRPYANVWIKCVRCGCEYRLASIHSGE